MLKPAGPPLGDTDANRSIADLAQQVLEDGRSYVEAEAQLLRVKAEIEAAKFKRPAILAVAAIVTGAAGLVALAVTVIIVLSSLIGPVAGGLVATFLFAAGAAGLGLAAKRAWDRALG